MSFSDTAFLKRFVQPCDEIQTLTYNIKEFGTDKRSPVDNKASLFFVFKSTKYKEIQHIPAFDVESLIGNMGGYVGLFLGFAFWQAPDAFKLIGNKLYKITNFLN